MDNVPDDILLNIKEYIYDYEDLLNLKSTCISFDKLITHFTLGKLMLYGKFNNYKSTIACVNFDCYWDTGDIFEDVYHNGYRRYIHSHQCALNKTTITINNKQYTTHTPYCSECFTNYVLIGDKPNVRHNLMMDEVNIDY